MIFWKCTCFAFVKFIKCFLSFLCFALQSFFPLKIDLALNSSWNLFVWTINLWQLFFKLALSFLQFRQSIFVFFFDFFQSAVFPPLCYILRVLLSNVKSFFLWGIFDFWLFDLWLIFNLGCVQIFSILLIFFCFFFTIAAARWWRIFRSAFILFYALLISSWCLILLSLNLCKLLSKYFLDLSVFFYFLVEFSLSKLFLDGLLYFWSDIYSFCRQIYNC